MDTADCWSLPCGDDSLEERRTQQNDEVFHSVLWPGRKNTGKWDSNLLASLEHRTELDSLRRHPASRLEEGAGVNERAMGKRNSRWDSLKKDYVVGGVSTQ